MSFGRRLAFFFILIALVPTLALAGMLVIVSEDSRQGKADARLAANLETALALYEQQVATARERGEELTPDPGFARGLAGENEDALQSFAEQAAAETGIEAVQVLDPDGEVLVESGSDQAIAFAELELTDGGDPLGTLRVSTTTAPQYSTEVQRLTKRELVVSRDGSSLSSTVLVPSLDLDPGETEDVEISEGEFRARLVTLDPLDGETLLLLGPRKEGGFFSIDRPAAVVLAGFLLLGIVFAYALARALTGLHTQVAQQAVTDPLTGLANRRRMREQLDREVDRAIRFKHELSFLILDVDEFKSINDEHGHPQGDAVLQKLADIVRETTRGLDITARYGGDELALVLLETDADGAMVLAERLRTRVEETRIPVRGGRPLKITISIGTATVPTAATEVDDLVEAGDQALLKAKRAGKNQTKAAPPGRANPAKSAT